MAQYSFVTRWHLGAPIDDVWQAIFHSERWPEWWRGVDSVVEIEAGDVDGVGALWRQRWRSRLPYALTFDMRVTTVESPVVLVGVADGAEINFDDWPSPWTKNARKAPKRSSRFKAPSPNRLAKA